MQGKAAFQMSQEWNYQSKKLFDIISLEGLDLVTSF
jgi:hypothetical protein